jgi:hypothetical protein
MGNSLHRGPHWGTLRELRFPELFERQMKKGSGNRVSLINLIWAPFWTQNTLGV